MLLASNRQHQHCHRRVPRRDPGAHVAAHDHSRAHVGRARHSREQPVRAHEIRKGDTSGIIVASVVPPLTGTMRRWSTAYFGALPLLSSRR